MAFELVCESSYFKESLFETHYNLRSHSKLPPSIRNYIRDIWILQYYQTKLSLSFYTQIIQYIITIYDQGFRMPKEGDPVKNFKWPKAVPLAYFERDMPWIVLPDFDLKRNSFIIARSGQTREENNGTYIERFMHATPTQYNDEDDTLYVDYVRNQNIGETMYIRKYLFMCGQIPVIWENDILIFTNAAQSSTSYGVLITYDAVDFHFIYKESGKYAIIQMRNIDFSIDPHIILYVTQGFTLSKADDAWLCKYIQNWRGTTSTQI